MPGSACPDTSTSPVPEPVRDAVRALLTARRIPGLALAVTTSGGPLFAAGFGSAVLLPHEAVTPDTAWPWFSMSKLVTATAAMALAEQGRLDLDAPFEEYLPDSASTRSTATVRQLLSHTAGIANPVPIRWVRAADAPQDDGLLYDRLREQLSRPRRAPGGRAAYTNLGYLALGRVLETAAHEPFRQLVQRLVLTPAGMTATGYQYEQAAKAATGYVRVPRPLHPLLRAVLPEGIPGPAHQGQLSLLPFHVSGAAYGGLVGPVTDAARFARLHLRDGELDGTRVLQEQTAREMRDVRWPGKPFDHGLGWFRKPVEDRRRPDFVEHYGAGAGFWNAMRLYPGEGLGMAVMANTTSPYDVDSLFEAVRSTVSHAS